MKTTKFTQLNPVCFVMLLFTLPCVPLVQATTNIALPFYEPFNYGGGIGRNLGNNLASGSDSWGNSRANPGIDIGNLSYPGLPFSYGNMITNNGGTAVCDNNGPRPNLASSIGSGVVYFSFLFRVRSPDLLTDPDPGRCVVAFCTGSGTSYGLSVNLANDNGAIKIGVVKWPGTQTPSGPGAYFSNPISTDGTTTYFVVAKYEFVPDADNNICTMWLNPSSAFFGGLNEDPNNKVVINTGTDGSFSFSRLYIKQGFFADIDELRIGRNWFDVVPASCSYVSFVSPPVEMTNGIGSSTAFSATVLGSSPTFRWRRDGTNLVDGGNISGATNATLMIDPITAADGVPAARGYSLVIANTCGGGSSQTSAPVALTLLSGANLTWKGDGGANEWDVATTANWNNNTAYFSNYDNVTFDDSSANTTVSVVGSPQPLQVLGNATSDYSLAGAIAEPAFVIKTNTGKLALGQTSTFKGKTTIKQGTLAISGETSLGSNPSFFKADQLLLDGGSLEVTLSMTMDDLNRGITIGSAGGKIEVDGGATLTMKDTIAGGASANLVKIGDGTLRMQSFNTYAGNTTVSNGVMFLDNTSGTPFGNGAGTLILAGGNLQVESRGDPTLDILNPVSVTADSELTTVQTSKSTVDFRLHNNASCLSGNSKLTIRDDSGFPAHLFYIRLYGSNLTYNGAIVLDPGSGPATMQLACNNQGGTHTFNGVISDAASGAGILMRRADSGPGGDTILNGPNTYGGGTVLLQGGIGFGISSVGPANAPTSGPIGTGTLSGGGSSTKVFASSGARNVGNPISITSSTFIIGGANDLTLSGDIDLFTGTRTLQVDNTGTSILSGNVGDGSLVKTGNGKLLLNGAVTVADVTVNAGTLGGTGTLSGTLNVNTNGTLSPGASIGTLTVNNDVTLAGNTVIEVNKTAGTRDLITGVNTLTYGGTLTVVNLSGTLTTSDTFTVFSATTPVGDFSSIIGSPGSGLRWNFNPANGVLSVVAVNPNPTNISYTVSGGTLNLTWPVSHFGWIAASNSVAIDSPSSWFDIPGSGSVTSLNVTFDSSKKNVFYRLHLP